MKIVLVMSSTYFNEIWHQSQHECEQLAIIDYERQHQNVDTTVATISGVASVVASSVAAAAENKALLQASLYEFYLRYICLSNRLEDVYDNASIKDERFQTKFVIFIIDLLHSFGGYLNFLVFVDTS